MKKVLNSILKKTLNREFYDINEQIQSDGLGTHNFNYKPFEFDRGYIKLTYDDTNSVVSDNFDYTIKRKPSQSNPISKPSSNDGCDLNRSKLQPQNSKLTTKYVINISNSQYFHIGTQETVNINQNICENGKSLGYDLDDLLESEKKVTEDCILVISLHLHHRWKEFLTYLGTEENLLECLEACNDFNRTYTIYDTLHRFIKEYPNTSLGFIIYALNEIREEDIIKKLALKISF